MERGNFSRPSVAYSGVARINLDRKYKYFKVGVCSRARSQRLGKSSNFSIMSHVKVLFGAFAFGSYPTETGQEFLDILKKYNVKDLDTAYFYVSKGASSNIEESN